MPVKSPYNSIPDRKIISKLGENLRTIREGKSITQLALAHAIGYSGERAGSYISRVESGFMMPRLDTLTRIAGVLEVTLEMLVNGGNG